MASLIPRSIQRSSWSSSGFIDWIWTGTLEDTYFPTSGTICCGHVLLSHVTVYSIPVHRFCFFIFPFKIKTKGKKMPLLIACSAFCFNLVNGLLNGYFLTVIDFKNLSTTLLITCLIVFLVGFYINIIINWRLFS